MKKRLSLVVVLCFALSFLPTAFAAETVTTVNVAYTQPVLGEPMDGFAEVVLAPALTDRQYVVITQWSYYDAQGEMQDIENPETHVCRSGEKVSPARWHRPDGRRV